METKQAAPANTAGIQRLEQKLQGLDDAVKETVCERTTTVCDFQEYHRPTARVPAAASHSRPCIHVIRR